MTSSYSSRHGPTDRRALTLYAGRAGDRNPHAMAGAALLAQELASRTGLMPTVVGVPRSPLNLSWDQELEAARPELHQLAAAYDQLLQARRVPVTIFGRCACALATLPVVACRRPDATIVWFDAHADANTPETTVSGYLGGLVLTGASGLWETGLGNGLTLSNVILIGARDIDPAELALIDNGTIRLVESGADIATRVQAAVGASPVYVHIDCDVLEPGIVPTEYRVCGGLSLADLRAVCQVLARNEVVGVEVAEFEAVWSDATRASPLPVIDALEPLLNSWHPR